MNCSPKTMIKIGAAIGIGLTAAYFAFPDAREFVVASAPILLALICPLSMIVMMVVMKKGRSGEQVAAKPPPAVAQVAEGGDERAPAAPQHPAAERA